MFYNKGIFKIEKNRSVILAFVCVSRLMSVIFEVATCYGNLCFEDDKQSIDKLMVKIPKKNNVFNLINKSSTINTLLLKTISPLEDIIDFINRCGLSYHITAQVHSKLKKLINELDDHNVWPALAAKPDYNACIFETRKFPYFAVESKTWSAAVMQNIAPVEYNRELTGVPVQPVPDNLAALNDDEILAIATQNNNYAAYDQLIKIDDREFTMLLTKLIKIDQDLAIYMVHFLLRSYKYYHICFKKLFWQFVAKHNILHLESSFWHAMYLAKQEETLIGKKITLYNRVIYTLQAANSIPRFTYDLENSPFNIHISDKKIDQQMIFFLPGARTINTMSEFKDRFNIATGGALKNINFSTFKAAITGSILIPCVHKSPLESGFDHPMVTNTPYKYVNNFDKYVEYFYPSYRSLTDEDYAQMCKPPSIKADFLHGTDGPSKTIEPELQELTAESAIDTYEDDQPAAAPVTKAPLQRGPEPDFNQLSDIDISITTRNFEVFKTRVNAIFARVQQNCEDKGPIYLVENRRISTTAFRIYGPGIIRPVDLFMVADPPIVIVKKFHLPCVKMYYDGPNLYMLSSCVSALMSGINYNYKWFSCNKVAGDIMIKYCNRGITTILNHGEICALTEYVRIAPRWEAISNRVIVGGVPHSDAFFTTEIGCRRGLRSMIRNVTPSNARLYITSTPSKYHANKHVIFNESLE